MEMDMLLEDILLSGVITRKDARLELSGNGYYVFDVINPTSNREVIYNAFFDKIKDIYDAREDVYHRLGYCTNFLPCPFERRKIIKYAIPAINFKSKQLIKARPGVIKLQRIFRERYYRPGGKGFTQAELEFKAIM